MSETQKTVLIAEDDAFIKRAYVDSLTRAGYEVLTASDGVEALDVARSQSPDLILLDLMMPVKNGFEFLEEACADESIKNIPVIILSNLGQDSDIKKCQEMGAEDYMIKSNNSMKDVVEKVAKFLT